MRSRTFREGSLGLFVIGGLVLVGAAIAWLRGWDLGRRSYEFYIQFESVTGMQTGAPVRYRGVTVGRINAIKPGPNGVVVTVEVNDRDLKIPRDSLIEANQTGFVSETAVDITPLIEFDDPEAVAPPLSDECNSGLIICDELLVEGDIGVSFEAFTRASLELAQTVSDPEFFEKIVAVADNTAEATEGIAELTEDFSRLSNDLAGLLQEELQFLSTSAITSSIAITEAADRIGASAEEIAILTQTVNDLVLANRATLGEVLGNLSRTSARIDRTVADLRPFFDRGQGLIDRTEGVFDRSELALDSLNRTLERVDRGVGQIDVSQILLDLEEVADNARAASENAVLASESLGDLSQSIADPATVLLLQETLASARATFQNAQKISADLEELTGNPEFRDNIRRLMEGLSDLVSYTEELERQVQVSQTIAPLEEAIEPLEANKKISPHSRSLPK